MPIVTVTAVILYVGDKIIEHFIQEEVWLKRIWYKTFPPKTFKSELVKVIHVTIDEFEIDHRYDDSEGKFPFYQSQVFFERLSMFVLFKKGSPDDFKGDFSKYPKLIPPTEDELSRFYDLFVGKVQNNRILKIFFIEENYKNQIYEISKSLAKQAELVKSVKADTTSIRASVNTLIVDRESNVLTPQLALAALNGQVESQLKKQVSSGKYIPDTFIESGEQKDNLRYLCDSIFYAEKCRNEINNLDFRYFNYFLNKKNLSPFLFEFENMKPSSSALSISNLRETLSQWLSYLSTKQQEIDDMDIGNNNKYKLKYKIPDKIKELEFLKASVALISEHAGQGKTNFLCDFCDRFILKRHIPTVFLTGVEIEANDIRQSILRRIFPNSQKFSFSDLLNTLKTVCDDQRKFFVIIIDGINENYNSTLLSVNLESFISEILEYDFVKIVLSCRTEYYNQNFSNLENSVFASDMKEISSILGHHPNDSIKKRLRQTYFSHFGIEHQGISHEAHQQLVENFLLLRIFCEVYKDQRLERIDDIYKAELFDAYYSIKCDEINRRLKGNDEFQVSGNFDIKNFIQSLVDFMVQENVYVNIPLDKIIANSNHREIYVRFLDENILMKRDMQINEGQIFSSSEVINFTFDEFRDYLISKYLIEVLYSESESKFTNFLESQITETSSITEGCSIFLFFFSREDKHKSLNEILQNQPWYESVFSKCIFSLRDSQITLEDISVLKKNITDNMEFSKSTIWNLILRHDNNLYENLNIDVLFTLLREFEEDQYHVCFSDKFGMDKWSHSEINQERLLSTLNEALEDKEVADCAKLFELLIYMFINDYSWDIVSTYEKFFFRHPEKGKLQLGLALESKNELLRQKVNEFRNRYDIKL